MMVYLCSSVFCLLLDQFLVERKKYDSALSEPTIPVAHSLRGVYVDEMAISFFFGGGGGGGGVGRLDESPA